MHSYLLLTIQYPYWFLDHCYQEYEILQKDLVRLHLEIHLREHRGRKESRHPYHIMDTVRYFAIVTLAAGCLSFQRHM